MIARTVLAAAARAMMQTVLPRQGVLAGGEPQCLESRGQGFAHRPRANCAVPTMARLAIRLPQCQPDNGQRGDDDQSRPMPQLIQAWVPWATKPAIGRPLAASVDR